MASLRENIGRRMLRRSKKKGQQRAVTVHNFDTAQSAAILFNSEDSESFEVIKECVKFLREKNIWTRVFAYVPQKEVPEELLFLQDYTYISKKDLNWYHKPSGASAEQFYQLEVDMLLDFTQGNGLELQYLVQLSRASFKIGCFTEEENDYDLMINLNAPCEAAFLYEQFRHYISMINPLNT